MTKGPGIRILAYLILALGLAWVPAFAEPNIPAEEYAAIRDLALQIAARYPADEYHYVSIGRTPSPIMRFLQELGATGQSTLPISGLRNSESESDQWHDARLNPRFEAHLPNARELRGKKILLLDHFVEGTTLARVGNGLERYLAAQGNPIPVTRLALLSTAADAADARKTCGAESIVVPRALTAALHLKRYSDYALFPYADIKDPIGTRYGTKPEYEELGRAIRAHMADDEALREFQRRIILGFDRVRGGPRTFWECLGTLSRIARARAAQ